ncbi:MAG TPA: hypothetical protein VK459_16915 [Polyangiaceae bacterium]|jgi:hypothetical protein|nr:hypothetical protein [Polyangiaceae bacterium]
MFLLEKRPYQGAMPQPTQAAQPAQRERDGFDGGAEEEPRSASYASRRRPIAPEFYSEPEEPLADSVRRAAEEYPDLAVATALPNSSTSR